MLIPDPKDNYKIIAIKSKQDSKGTQDYLTERNK